MVSYFSFAIQMMNDTDNDVVFPLSYHHPTHHTEQCLVSIAPQAVSSVQKTDMK
jgi:hypothetical protein